MRKIILLFLSVTILSIAGCGKKDMAVSNETKATSETESIKATEKTTETEVVEAATEEIKTDNEEEEDTQTANEDSNDQALEQSENRNDSDGNQNSSNGQSTDTNQGQNSQPQQAEQTPAPEPEPTPEPTPEPEQPQVINYSPENVVALATAKTKAAGKILLTENLDNLLANGKITQEEYNEYYPYDGAGYFSVFVDSNMAEARDVSGTEHFNSEDDIAQYISDLLVLENGPLFLIEYAGTYDYYGKICYEFRCYRG